MKNIESTIVYTLEECPNCKIAKEMLVQKSIPFKEQSLRDPDVLTKLNIKGIFPQSAPLIFFSSTFLNFSSFMEAINASGC